MTFTGPGLTDRGEGDDWNWMKGDVKERCSLASTSLFVGRPRGSALGRRIGGDGGIDWRWPSLSKGEGAPEAPWRNAGEPSDPPDEDESEDGILTRCVFSLLFIVRFVGGKSPGEGAGNPEAELVVVGGVRSHSISKEEAEEGEEI